VPGAGEAFAFALCAGHPVCGDLQVWDRHVHDREHERLRPVEPLRQQAIGAEGGEFVQPRHQYPGAVLTETKNLCGPGVATVEKLFRMKSVGNMPGISPEHLVHEVVAIQIQRGCGD